MTTRLVLALKIRKKARYDNVDFLPTVNRVARTTTIKTVIGDKAFGAQKSHNIVHKHGALLIMHLRNADAPVRHISGPRRQKILKS